MHASSQQGFAEQLQSRHLEVLLQSVADCAPGNVLEQFAGTLYLQRSDAKIGDHQSLHQFISFFWMFSAEVQVASWEMSNHSRASRQLMF